MEQRPTTPLGETQRKFQVERVSILPLKSPPTPSEEFQMAIGQKKRFRTEMGNLP